MDILIFLGTLLAVLVGGFLLIKLVLHARSSGRCARKHVTVPADSRLKQRHTGRPYLQHQTLSRSGKSDEIWKESRHKVNEPQWQNGSFTAHRMMSDADKDLESRKKREEPAMSSVEYGPTEPTGRPASAGAAKRGAKGV